MTRVQYQLTIIIMTLSYYHTASYHNARGVTVHSIVTASASPPLGLKEKSHFENKLILFRLEE